MKKVLILWNKQKNQKDVQFFKNNLASLNFVWKEEFIHDALLCISSNIKKSKIIFPKFSIDDFQLVYLRQWTKNPAVAYAFAQYLNRKKITFIESELLYWRERGNKLMQAAFLASNTISIPLTLYCELDTIIQYADTICKTLKFPFIMKDVKGYKGKLNFLIRSKSDLLYNAQKYKKEQFVFQEYIENDFDYRILVLGYRAVAIYKRIRTSKQSHLNNYSQGSKVEYEILTHNRKIINIAEKVSKLFNREVCGVDIIKSKKTNNLYVLEVNPAPGLSSSKNLIKYLENYLSKLTHKQIKNSV